MRWLTNFTIGFACACICFAYLHLRNLWFLGIVVLGLLFLLRNRWKWAVLLSGVMVGFLVGQLWSGMYESIFLAPVRSLNGITQAVTIRAADYSNESSYGMSVDGGLVVDGKQYQVRVYLDAGDPVVPGESLTGDFRFRVTVPDGEEEGTSHPGKGIFLLAYQEGEITRQQTAVHWRDIPAKLRLQIKNILRESFPEDAFPFAKALLLGDTSDLSYAVDTDFKVSGIRHVVAVSGLHVSILFALISVLTLRRRVLTALIGFPALFFFAALAGFSPSVVRSCVMCGLMLLAMLTNQEYDGPTALSFAVLVMLVFNPLVVTSVSLQLSVGSVTGIFLFQGRLQNYLRSHSIPKWAAASVSITLSAMSITTPLCAWYFGMVSLVSPLTNLLALWVISSIFYGILGVCVLSFVMPAMAGVLASAIAWPIRYVLWVAKTMAALPLAAVYTVSIYVVFWLVFLYLLLALSGKICRPVTLTCCAYLGLCAALAASWAQDTVRFTVLDVGQGQCLLFQAAGKSVMVDCGGDRASEAADLAAETLLSQGIDLLDVMILTHLDDDHAGGAELLLTRMDVGLLVLPWEYDDFNTGRAQGVLYATENLLLDIGDSKVQIFSPGFSGNGNEMSLCVLFDTKMCDILVTGDRSGFGERLLLRREQIPEVDVLIAGHHGAKTSTSEELLAAVQPKTVCISAGRDNRYGHPAPELLARLTSYGCQIYRTDLQGTITIRR